MVSLNVQLNVQVTRIRSNNNERATSGTVIWTRVPFSKLGYPYLH